MSKFEKWLAVLCVAVALILSAWCLSPVGRACINEWFFHVQKADDATSYKTRKTVEDTCRSMIASYTSDRLVYEQYKDSEDAAKKSWAEMAQMRANKTAASYNEYVIKNSFVWSGNIPEDIDRELPYI